jgi:hypothetical protein
MAGLADFIATGDRSSYIVKTLHDHETFAAQEREAIKALDAEVQQPLYLPSVEEVEAEVAKLDDRLQQDPESAPAVAPRRQDPRRSARGRRTRRARRSATADGARGRAAIDAEAKSESTGNQSNDSR